MKKIIIEDLSDIAELMYSNIVEKNFSDTMFVGYYEDAIMILKHLLIFDETVPYHIKIEDIDWDGYEKEYYVTLDSEMNIWCEPAYDYENNRYLENETGCLYVADDCNSALLKHVYCPKDEMYEVSYSLDSECDGKCDHCKCSERDDNNEIVTRVAVDEDGTIRGFEKSWSTHEDGMYYHSTYTHYSNNPDMLKHMMDNFDIRF